MKHITILLILATFSIVMAQSNLQMSISDKVAMEKLGEHKRALALDIALILGQEGNFQLLNQKVSERNTSIDMIGFLQEANTANPNRDGENFVQTVASFDRQIREIKGVADRIDSILEIRLVNPECKINSIEDVLVAYVPNGNERSWKSIEAFDCHGKSVELDVYNAPDRPVILAGLNARKDMEAGLSLLNEELQKAGVQYSAPQNDRAVLEVSKLDYIRLEDDQEPWLLGDAEIYTLVNGIAPEAEKSNILAMEMPYLTTDKKDYRPNQVLIVWQNYRFNAANLNIYEHDDNTNYKEIAAFLVDQVGKVLPEYKYIFDIASQIIKLMPDKWWSNDDDYVDVFYTIEKGKTYNQYSGASNNARITLVPYTISGN